MHLINVWILSYVVNNVCCDLYSTSTIDTLRTQNLNQSVLTLFIRDVAMLCCLFDLCARDKVVLYGISVPKLSSSADRTVLWYSFNKLINNAIFVKLCLFFFKQRAKNWERGSGRGRGRGRRERSAKLPPIFWQQGISRINTLYVISIL